MISVQHNMLAENANRQLNINTKKNAKTAEKLSSGYKINRAADDAAGLAISEKMRRQVRGLGQAADNIKEGIGYVQTAEGALNEAQDILQRINQLSVQAANGTNTVSDRAYINSEVQALKEELSRIFSTTTFNEERIWEPDEYTPIVGQESRPAVRVSRSGSILGGSITNDNVGILPDNGTMNVKKEEEGITVEWTGHNGVGYSTKLIPWDEIVENNYSIEISEYFKESDTELWLNDKPKLSYAINLDVHENATLQQVKDSIPSSIDMVKSVTLSSKNGDGNTTLGDRIYAGSGTFYYDTAYYLNSIGKFDFDDHRNNDDPLIVPNKIMNNGASNLKSYPNAASRNSGWTFSFNVDGIGTVEAVSSDISYSSSDERKDKDGNYIWWATNPNGDKYALRGYTYDATLENALKALRRNPDMNYPGLLDDSNGGTITIHFTLDHIGNFPIYVGVSADETEDDVLKRITGALNKDTILDLHTSEDSADFVGWEYYSGQVEVPVYGEAILQGRENFWVQAGAEAGQHIDIEYESLSLWALGMQDTDVLTVESASRAINEVKGALQVVSEQRSLFGAYQNRLEHAYNINKNVEENTQASESLIRDTDIADAMMEYSINNILLQAGTSMLTQANQSSQLITQLLG